jgi:GAF domain-containing protein
LIRERFGLYYVGLFLRQEADADTGEEWAVLRAGTGEAGRAMLARGHRLKVGEGMIGWSIAHNEARIALDVGQDATRFDNPDLPDTRSEVALPLRSRGRVLGALTVQSAEEAAFDQDTIVVLQTMADQVAVALDNADLFAQSQTALEAQRRAYGEISRQSWMQMIRSRPSFGYQADERGVTPLDTLLAATEATDGEAETLPEVVIPVRVRDNVIGSVVAHKSGGGEWTEKERSLLEALVDGMDVALDSARQYQTTQRREIRERLTRESVDRIRAADDIAEILQVASRTLSEQLSASEVVIRLGTETKLTGDHG